MVVVITPKVGCETSALGAPYCARFRKVERVNAQSHPHRFAPGDILRQCEIGRRNAPRAKGIAAQISQRACRRNAAGLIHAAGVDRLAGVRLMALVPPGSQAVLLVRTADARGKPLVTVRAETEGRRVPVQCRARESPPPLLVLLFRFTLIATERSQ